LEQYLLDVARDALLTVIKIASPVLLIGLVVGLTKVRQHISGYNSNSGAITALCS